MEESFKKMAPIRLNEIPKKELLEVPERYFDELPLKIQKRIPQSRSREHAFNLVHVLKWAPALILVVLLSLWWLVKPETQTSTFEEQLALITDEEIIIYLEDSEISTEDIIETVSDRSLIIEDTHIEDIIDQEIINDEELEELINNNLSAEEYYN